MATDLNPRDLEELRRRVIDPVVKSLVHPDELEEILVEVDEPLPGVGIVIVRVRACGEWIPASAGSWPISDDRPLWDAEGFAADLYEDLREEMVQSRLSWGEWRDGNYQVLGPRLS